MSSVIGTFESGIFGAGYFGVIQDAILTMGTVVNENIINAITQTVENGRDRSFGIRRVDYDQVKRKKHCIELFPGDHWEYTGIRFAGRRYQQ